MGSIKAWGLGFEGLGLMVLGFRALGFRGQGLGLGFVKRSIRPYAGVPTLLKFEIGFRFRFRVLTGCWYRVYGLWCRALRSM